MIETLLIIFGIVIDTFIISSVNNQGLTNNLKNYLGIETTFAIIGCSIGGIIINYIPENTFKIVCGVIIILIQAINLCGYSYPEKINALLLGADSLIIFSTIPYYYIPILFISELIMIFCGSYVGSRIIKYIPCKKYVSNIVMVIIALTLII